MERLTAALAKARGGFGSTILVSGEIGIGKTRLVEEFMNVARSNGAAVLSGAALSGAANPFQIFSKVLADITTEPLFEENEHASFAEVFAVNEDGSLAAKSSTGGGCLDANAFAGMLSAVQAFVRDSFGRGGEGAGLGLLECGDMKILMEHGRHMLLAAVLAGNEHPEMRRSLKSALQKIEGVVEHPAGAPFAETGKANPVQDEIDGLSRARFFVRKDMEGVRLEKERLKIADRVLECIAAQAKGKTVVVFLEDLHWADESSLFVLTYLARNIGDERILILATSRRGVSAPLLSTVEKMKGEGSLDELALGKLCVDDVLSLVRGVYSPNDFPETLAKRLFEQAKGNPLFITELLAGMGVDGSVVKVDGRFRLVSETYQIPATVEEVVNRRLESLAQDSMALLEYASCIGQRFEASAVESCQMLENPKGALQNLSEAGILLKCNGTLEFSHAIFQSVVYNGIGERWKSEHHKSIGEYLERVNSDNIDDVIYDLARHFSKTREFDKCSRYCIGAGEKAEASFAVEQALEFYDGAVVALSRTGNPLASDGKADILERTGDLRFLMGNYDEAILKFQMAEDLVKNDENRARIFRKVATAYDRKGEFDKCLEVIACAKKVAKEGTAEYGRILIAEGQPYWKRGDIGKALRLYLEAVAITEKAGTDKRDIGNALRAIGVIHNSRGDSSEAMRYYERSLAIMEEVEDHYGIAAALNNMGNIHHAMGNGVKALELHLRSLEILEKIGDKWGVAVALNNIGFEYVHMGESEHALEFYGRSLELREKIGDRQGVAISLNNIGTVHHRQGDPDSAIEFHGRSLGIFEKIGDRWGVATAFAYLGSVHQDKGDMERAMEFYKRGYEIREGIGDKRGMAQMLCNMAEIDAHLMQVQKAMEKARKALALSIEIRAKPEEGASRRTLGMVQRMKNNLDEAEEEFAQAKSIFDEAGNEEESARLSYEYACLFKLKGENDRARRSLEHSISVFEGIGLRTWAEKCRKSLEEP